MFIDFLKWCLHLTDAVPSCVSDINWADLLAFAKKQTIVGIYWQGIQRLGDFANKPSEDDVMEWMGEYQKITRKNAKIDDTVVKLTKFMNDNNIDFFVFKGQTVARYYPTPESRTSGDIDFYVFSKERNRALSLLQEKVQVADDHSGQHWEFTYDGIPYEMHYHTAVFANNCKQRYLDDLIDSYFDDVLDHVYINNVSVPTLPPTINAIYLFIHIYHHFLKEGIALRQFIDWMMFFEAKHDEIVVSELSAKLKSFGLTKAFRAFGAVIIDVLGMDAKYFPFEIKDSDRKYEKKIMNIVLKYGNFGKYGRYTPTILERRGKASGWWHSIETGMRSVKHVSQFFWLSPSENLLYLLKLIKNSLKKNLSS